MKVKKTLLAAVVYLAVFGLFGAPATFAELVPTVGGTAHAENPYNQDCPRADWELLLQLLTTDLVEVVGLLLGIHGLDAPFICEVD